MAKGHQMRQKLVSYTSMESTTNERKRSGSTHKDVGNRIEGLQRCNEKDKKSGPHPNIVTRFNVAFNTDTSYIFVPELASEGNLSFFLERQKINESQAKSVMKQITFALEFIHSKDIVHRNISLENIFVFSKDLSTVKLGNFSETHRAGSLQGVRIRYVF